MTPDEKIMRDRLHSLLLKLGWENHGHFTILTDETAQGGKDAGLLQPYHGFDSIDMRSAGARDTMELLAKKQRAEGKEIVSTDGELFYTVEIAPLRELVDQLYGKQTVNENTHREDYKPQEEEGNWQRAVTHKDEDAVLLAVRVEPEIRNQFHALMRARGITAQEFLSAIVNSEVKNHPDLVKKGEQMEAQGTKRNYRSKLQILKDEVARLRGLGSR